MRYCFAALLILFCFTSFSQIAYTDFIQKDNSIQWAGEYDQLLNITPKIKKYRISNFLYNRLLQQGCIDNYTTNAGLHKSKYCISDTAAAKDVLVSAINPYKYYYLDINGGAGPEFIKSEINAKKTGLLADTRFDIFLLRQLFYYKNGQLLVNNVLATPLTLTNEIAEDGADPKLVWQSACSSLFSDSGHVLSGKEKRNCIDLGTAEADYNFLYSFANDSLPLKVFTLNNPGFSHHLIQDLMDGRITAVDDKLNVIPASKILGYGNEPVKVAQFDNNGNIKGYKLMQNEVNLDSFYKFTINQHFYLDTANQKLYSEVDHIVARIRIMSAQGMDFGFGDLFRVYFVKPALYKKPITKRFLNN